MDRENLIPITKVKISKEKWLQTPIKYEMDYYLKDILLLLSNKTYQWILSKEDLKIIKDYDSFHQEFVDCFYQNYIS